MSGYYERCAHCGQWISPLINHYVKVQDDKGWVYFLHLNPCYRLFSETRNVFIVEEHVNQRI